MYRCDAQANCRLFLVETIYHHLPAVDTANAITQACRPEIGMHDELALTCRISLQTKSPSPQHLLQHFDYLYSSMLFPVRVLHRACLTHSPLRYTIGHMAYFIPQVRSPGSKRGCRRATD